MLVSSSKGSPELKSLDLASPWFGQGSSCCRNLLLPFEQPPPREGQLLGSCNGLVFVTLENDRFYVWNPLTGFFKRLPDIGYSFDGNSVPEYFGAGYLSAADNYKVLVGYMLKRQDGNRSDEMVHIFSLEDHIWRIIDVDYFGDIFPIHQGIVSNEALHWLHYTNGRFGLSAFDLAKEEFRIMQLPNLDVDGRSWFGFMLGVVGGCLCVSNYTDEAISCDSVDFWVMREYGVSESWSMLFSLKLSHPYQWCINWRISLLVLENSTVVAERTGKGFELKRIDHKGDQEVGEYMLQVGRMCMVDYEESLLWISGYHPVQETEQVQILETHYKASVS